jgi:hypothetical protein
MSFDPTNWLHWLALYLSPVGLFAFFLVYAAGRRLAFPPLVWLGTLGIFSDTFNAYTLGQLLLGPWPWRFPDRSGSAVWKARTVTALATHKANAGHRGALWLCRFLNFIDPGHCKLAEGLQ